VNPAPQPCDLLATCAFGLEAVVARELADLGFDAKPIGTGRVRFAPAEASPQALHEAIIAANLWLRAADRVLVRVGEFPVGAGDPGFDQLFEGVKAIAWEQWIHVDAAFPIAARCVRSAITSEPAVQRVGKRAMVERLRARQPGASGDRPLREVGPPVAVEVAIRNDLATVTIDTSGVGLHKRGYRSGAVGEAAIKETLAAGLVLLSVWRPGRPLVDPFCGSGTIAIEAAMLGRGIAPGLKRGFAAERWWHPSTKVDAERTRTLIDPALWAEARAEAVRSIVPDRLDPLIHASDIDESAIRLARANARDAGVEHDIQFSQREFSELASRREFGVVITNPPYGVRLGETAEIDRLYAQMPVVFRRLPTWSFHLFTGRLDLERVFGQEATRRRKMYNSTIECGYFSFLGPRPPQGDRPPLQEDPALSTSAPELETSDADRPEEAEPALADGSPGDEELLEIAAPAEASATPRPATPPPAQPKGPVFGGLSERARRESEDFGRCLEKNLRHLRRYPSRGVTCYRVYERDVPDVPLIIDRYEDRYHVAEYERPHDRSAAQQADWHDLMRETIARVGGVPVNSVYMKQKHRQRGLSQHERADDAGEVAIVGEGGLRFEVNLSDYVDTGLFLDHRLTRARVREESAGKRVLNLFCYTGAFTAYAAAGGASRTVSVDLSNTYLAWAERNLSLNNLTGPAHALVRSDTMAFLEDPRTRAEGLFDLAVVDPPTFSNSSMTEEDWTVADGHRELLTRLASLLSPGGVVYFSNNYRRFKLDEDSLRVAGYTIREISAQTVPPEYRNRRIHRCWRLVKTP
jgi:23S rRNA (guanine2445-N2)-methyltransferase / 23S rRNA (guanine2069-N7)-methyltransferase